MDFQLPLLRHLTMLLPWMCGGNNHKSFVFLVITSMFEAFVWLCWYGEKPTKCIGCWLWEWYDPKGESKLRWTKSAMIEVHFCIVFSVIKTFTINMSIKNHSFARTISCPPFLIHYWILWMKKFPSNSDFWHWKWDNELLSSQRYLNVYSHL